MVRSAMVIRSQYLKIVLKNLLLSLKNFLIIYNIHAKQCTDLAFWEHHWKHQTWGFLWHSLRILCSSDETGIPTHLSHSWTLCLPCHHSSVTRLWGLCQHAKHWSLCRDQLKYKPLKTLNTVCLYMERTIFYILF